MFKSKMSWNLS